MMLTMKATQYDRKAKDLIFILIDFITSTESDSLITFITSHLSSRDQQLHQYIHVICAGITLIAIDQYKQLNVIKKIKMHVYNHISPDKFYTALLLQRSITQYM